MTTMIAEVYDALRDAGAPDEKARRAAEVLASGDARHSEILLKFKELEVRFKELEVRFKDLEIRVERLEGRFNTLTWMVGANITLTILVLGKLLVA